MDRIPLLRWKSSLQSSIIDLSHISLSSLVSSSFSYTKLSKVIMLTYVSFVLTCGIKAVCSVTPIGSLSPHLMSQSIWACLFVYKSCLCAQRDGEIFFLW